MAPFSATAYSQRTPQSRAPQQSLRSFCTASAETPPPPHEWRPRSPAYPASPYPLQSPPAPASAPQLMPVRRLQVRSTDTYVHRDPQHNQALPQPDSEWPKPGGLLHACNGLLLSANQHKASP